MPAPKHKQVVNFSVDRHLVERFRETADLLRVNLSECYSAAMLMYLEAHPETQGEFLKRIRDAEVAGGVEAAIAAAKEEQLKKIKKSEEGGKPRRTT